MDVSTLREMFRNLQGFRVLYESEGIDTIQAPDGTEWNLWDLEYLYRQTDRLPPRQRQAIHLCLIENRLEEDVARIMGVSPTNPVAKYATSGLEKLIAMIHQGVFPRFRADEQEAV